MAGHLPIKLTSERLSLLADAQNVLKDITENYKRVELKKHNGFKALILPVDDYNMDDETGLVDHKVIAVEGMYDILEFHINKSGGINQVYLVM